MLWDVLLEQIVVAPELVQILVNGLSLDELEGLLLALLEPYEGPRSLLVVVDEDLEV